MATDDFLIIGGGVVGLSLAYELAGEGHRVRVIDRSEPGREASWAGAGILPPASKSVTADPLDQLTALSHRLHVEWADQLKAETGIDNGYRRCGAIYLACSENDEALLRAAAEMWRSNQVACEEIPVDQLGKIEPSMASDVGVIRTAWFLADECQLRNPRHLKALIAACAQRGVEIHSAVEAVGIRQQGNAITHVRTTCGEFSAGNICLATGAWTGALGDRFGLQIKVKPIRGQIVLLNPGSPRLKHIINVGPKYLVPRPDSFVLIGSTEEDVGFDKRTTAEATRDLLQFALQLAPGLADARIERSWAGLRPSSADGLPYLGRVEEFDNLYVAAGHFRGGLHLSPGTAVVMAQLMLGGNPQIDLAPFSLNRR